MKRQDKIIILNDYKNAEEMKQEKASGQQRKTTVKQETKKRKKKSRLKIKWKRVFAALFTVVFAFVFIYSVGSSPLFDIKTITVQGNETIATEKIINLSEIETGDNFFAVRVGKAEENLEYYPFIEQAEVKRKLFNKIAILVKERPAIGYVVTPDGYIQVSADARMLAVQQTLNNYNLPVISGVELDELTTLGGVIENKKLQQALKVLSSCDKELLNNLAELNVSQDGEIVAYTNQKLEVRLGSMDNVEKRLSDLNDIIRKIMEQKIPFDDIEYIDVRYAGVPVIKMKD